MNIPNFLIDLNEKVSIFTEDMSTLENTSVEDKKLVILKYELALMYYTIINSYFTTTISGDNNFMEFEEIQTIIDKLNNIMDTQLYVEI